MTTGKRAKPKRCWSVFERRDAGESTRPEFPIRRERSCNREKQRASSSTAFLASCTLELQALAFRSKSSLSRLGLLAIEQLLIRARQGTLPLLPPADFENAIEVGALGIPTGN